jgi:nucleotide-binding universal stress UspA family protein
MAHPVSHPAQCADAGRWRKLRWEETMSAAIPFPQADSLPLREIFFPSDLSPASALAFQYARLLARRFRARLTLFHAIPAGPGPSVPEPVRRAERAARERLEGWAEDLGARSCVVVEPTESVHRAVVGYVRGTTPDIVVMATHGRDGLSQLLLGSVTETVIRRGWCPVLGVREPQHGVALPFRRILVPTDLSPASRRSFALGGTLARAFDAEVLGLHVARVEAGSIAGVTAAVEAALPTETALQDFLQPEFRGVPVFARTELGSPWEQILRLARLEKADLIMLTTHGHDSLGDRLLGSHAERILREAPCPVLVV